MTSSWPTDEAVERAALVFYSRHYNQSFDWATVTDEARAHWLGTTREALTASALQARVEALEGEGSAAAPAPDSNEALFERVALRLKTSAEAFPSKVTARLTVEDLAALLTLARKVEALDGALEALKEAMDSRAPDLADAAHPGWYDRARAALARALGDEP